MPGPFLASKSRSLLAFRELEDSVPEALVVAPGKVSEIWTISGGSWVCKCFREWEPAGIRD